MATIEAGTKPILKTGRPCRCCTSPRRLEIDAALVAGGRLADLASRFDINRQSIVRHRDHHMASDAMAAGARAVVEADTAHGGTLAEQASTLRDKALSLLAMAEAAGDVATALRGVREARACIETMAKLTGEIDESATINITLAPALLELQSCIMQALAHHPEARRDVVAALGRLSGRDDRLTIEHSG